MEDFKFNLGETVVIDPAGVGQGQPARIIGQTIYEDGSRGYQISVASVVRDGVVRMPVSELEVRPSVLVNAKSK